MPFLYYEVEPMFWAVDAPFPAYQFTDTQPEPFTLDFPIWWDGILYPAGFVYTWIISTFTPAADGWWMSVENSFAGQSFLVNNSRPKDPRGYTEIGVFATGNAGVLGGFPGPSAIFSNHLVYAEGGYTPATDNPVIRIFDGQFDREVIRLPSVGGVPPIAVMSMLTANSTIYFSTLDSGTTSANWSGRVFSLSIETGKITPVGDPFPAGHVPYALAWHMGRLWCGTHRGSSAASGKVYFFRPDIDTTWTQDYDLSAASVAGVSSMLSYKGLLYVGTTAAAGTFAKVLVRSTVGVYTTSDTGTGGAATANNGYLAMAEFADNLYASYWNNDAPKISKIRKFDNSSWSTVYTGTGTTLVPYVGFPVDDDTLLAIGGGLSYTAALLTTPNGTTWTDRSVFLTQGTPASTGLPVFGVVVH